MSVVPVYNQERQEVGTIDLNETVFAGEVREHLFHEIVRAQRQAKRQFTRSTKGRSEVAGSGKKIYKQKGTGNARHGDRKATQFVGGGTVFGPKPGAAILKVNKKTRRAALFAALSRRAEENAIVVIDDLGLSEIKTKKVLSLMKTFDLTKTLFVDVENDNLSLSTRNLKTAAFVAVDGINVYDILKYDKLVLSQAAVIALNERGA